MACDRPAAAKIGGFLGHSSKHACSYCTKVFPYNNKWKKIDSSGFNVFPECNHADHRKNGTKWLQVKTQAERKLIENKFGSRFSQLCMLPYFDSVHHIIIDPMHNLFEGTAKRVLLA